MTAATWPDGTPKRRGASDAWNGTKPLVAPPSNRPVELGDIVWEEAPGDAAHDLRGGLVVGSRVDDETGERWLTVIDSHTKAGKFTIRRREIDASLVDPSRVTPRSAARLYRGARQVCKALGETQGGHITGFDRWLLEVAAGLVLMADEDIAERAGALREREAS